MMRALLLLAGMCSLPCAFAVAPPYLRLTDNLSEPASLGFCIDLRGWRPVKFTRTQLHSCKPTGGKAGGGADQQFAPKGGAIIGLDMAAKHCLQAKSSAAGADIDAPLCDAKQALQQFTWSGGKLQLKGTKLCLSASTRMRQASCGGTCGNFQGRDLSLALCTSTAKYITWCVVKTKDGKCSKASPAPAPAKVNCVGAYSAWGTCSKTCGAGSQVATFKITKAAANGGTACAAADKASKSQACTVKACPVPAKCVGGYGAWSACSKTCGGGTQTATYAIGTAAANGGKACAVASGATKSQACSAKACACPKGSYAAGTACTACPSGSTTDAPGSLSAFDCKCPAGQNMINGKCDTVAAAAPPLAKATQLKTASGAATAIPSVALALLAVLAFMN